MFQKIFTIALSLLSFNLVFAAVTTFDYEDPVAKRGLHVKFSIPATPETAMTAEAEMRSVTAADVPNIAALYGNEEVMQYYMDGKPCPADRIKSIYDTGWGPKLEAGNPWLVYPVFNKSAFKLKDDSSVEPDTFLGFVGMAVDEGVGCSLFFGMGAPKFWNHHLASHITEAVVGSFVPALVDQGFKIIKGDKTEPFTHVVAYAHPENAYSHKILKKYANPTDTVAHLGGGVTQPRKQYKIPVTALMAKRDAR